MAVPEPTRQRLREYYSSSLPYISTMQSHDEEYFATYVSLVLRVAASIRSDHPHLLDLGCGSGFSTQALARGLNRFSCVGVDLSQPATKYASLRFSGPSLNFAVADGLRLPFADGSFSVVASCDVIEHMPDTGQALSEMARLVEPGGAVVIKAPHHRNPVLPFVDLITFRDRYPFTKSWGENLSRLIDLSVDFIRKAVSEEIDYRSRVPDLSNSIAVGNDADAVYEVSVFDLIKFFRRRGFTIEGIACPRRNHLPAKLYTKALPYLSSVGLVARRGKTGKQDPRRGPKTSTKRRSLARIEGSPSGGFRILL